MSLGDEMNYTFNFEQLQKTIEDLTPKLLYATTEFAEAGQIYIVNATQWTPRFVVLHPDDLDWFRKEIAPTRLVHIRDEPSDYILEQIKNRIKASTQLRT